MDQRKQNLLKLIIENHVDTGLPVGSKFLVEKTGIKVSGATVRNEMRDLEEQGFLTHPHTSAGRIPTEKGYQFYIENLFKPEKIKKKTKEEIDKVIVDVKDNKQKIKALAKCFANWTGNAIIAVFDNQNIYYTGISYFFSQPEFRDYSHMISVSSIFDQCEEKLDELYELIDSEETKILVGRNNPLGSACSLIGIRFNKKNILTMLGPMRMNYSTNVGLMQYAQSLYEKK